MDSLNRLKRAIKQIISGSSVPEDPVHAENTVRWVKRLKPDAGESLLVAALGHDIERAIEGRKVRRSWYSDYDEFKKAHALNSARILKELMTSYGINQELIEDVHFLVLLHETGGDPTADILRDADAISFFDVNLPHYYEREGFDNTIKRVFWGYSRISEKNRHFLRQIKVQDKKLREILDIVTNRFSENPPPMSSI